MPVQLHTFAGVGEHGFDLGGLKTQIQVEIRIISRAV
jgi:hypothetical protein